MSLRTIIHLDNEQLNLKTNKQLLAYIKRLHKRDITLTDYVAQEKSIQKLPKGIQDQLNDITKGLPYGWREQISSLCMRLRTVTDKLGIYVHSTTGEIAEAIGKLNTHTSKIPPRGTVGKLERLLDGIYTAMGFATEDDYSRVKPNSSSLIKEIGRLRDSLNQFPDDLQRQLSSMVPDGSTYGWHGQLQDLMNRHLCTLKALHLDKESNGSHIVEAIGRLENAKNIPHGGYGQFVIDAAIAAGLRETGQYKYADIIDAINDLNKPKDSFPTEQNLNMANHRQKTIEAHLGLTGDDVGFCDIIDAIENLKEMTQSDISLTNVAKIGNMVPGSQTLNWNIKCMLSRIVEACNTLEIDPTSTTSQIVEAIDKLKEKSNTEMYRTRLSNIAGMLDIPSKLLDTINTEDFAKAIDKFKEVTQAELSPATLERIRRMVPGKQTLDWNIQCLLSRLLETCNTLGLPITSTSTTGEIVEAIRELKSDLGNCKTSIASSEESDKQIATCLGIDYDTAGTSDYIDAIENLQKGSNTFDISKETLSNVDKLFPHPSVTEFDDRVNRMFLRIEATCANLDVGIDTGVLDIQRAIRDMKKTDVHNEVACRVLVLQRVAAELRLSYTTEPSEGSLISAIKKLKSGNKKDQYIKELEVELYNIGEALGANTNDNVDTKEIFSHIRSLMNEHHTDQELLRHREEVINDHRTEIERLKHNLIIASAKSGDTPELIELRKIEDKYIKLALWVADALAEED
jgi:hypothetical protein